MAEELSLKAVRQFMLHMGGSVRNKDIVRHFKDFINDPNTKAQMRETFKEYVNQLSQIKTIDGERFLVLKTKFQVNASLPFDATSDLIRRHLQLERSSPATPAQDACSQAIASARAIQDLYSPTVPPRRSRKSSVGVRQPYLLIGENTVFGYSSGPETATGSATSTVVTSPVTSPIELEFDTSSEPGTPVDVTMAMKSVAVPRGPSQSIRQKAEALQRGEEKRNGEDFDVENVGVVMETVAAKAAALGEKLDLGGDDDVDGSKSNRSQVAAAVLDIDRSSGEKLDTVLVRPQIQHRPTASRSDRTRALKETFTGVVPSPVLGGGSRFRSYSTVVGPQKSPGVTRRDLDSGAGLELPRERSPTVGASGFSPVMSRASSHWATRRHGPIKKKDSKGSLKTGLEAKDGGHFKDGGHGSDGEYSDEGEDDHEFSQDFSHVALDVMEREWLMVASEANFSHVNQMLLRNSSLVNKKDFINGYTALHWAIKLNKSETVMLLLESNADPNLKTHGGQTALHLAAKFGRNYAIPLLVNDYGVNIYARDHAGNQPRDMASEKLTEESKTLIDWKDVDSNPPVSEIPLKTSGSYVSDIQDGPKKPSRSRNLFSPGILRRSIRRLRGKDKKEKVVITHVFSQPNWTDEPEPGKRRFSTSEGDLTDI